MAKSLGMIHTLNYEIQDIESDGDLAVLDLSGLLSEQLQHQVRAGNYFKMTGLDITVTDFDDTVEGGGQISGRIEYWSPTRGRCAAYRGAFASMREAFKRQGISMKNNPGYDFRPLWSEDKGLTVSTYGAMADYDTLLDNATLDGNEALCIVDGAGDGYEIFTTHNKSVQPKIGGFVPPINFQTGFSTGVNDGNDFVFNEGLRNFQANPNWASVNCESIPFQVSYSPGSSDIAVQFNWRPDPALFIAAAFGMIRVVIEELDKDDSADALKLEVAVHIAGWKSIMGDPDAKKNRRNRSKSRSNNSHSNTKTETTVTTVKKS